MTLRTRLHKLWRLLHRHHKPLPPVSQKEELPSLEETVAGKDDHFVHPPRVLSSDCIPPNFDSATGPTTSWGGHQDEAVKQQRTSKHKFVSTTSYEKGTANTQSNTKSEAEGKDKNSSDGDRSAIPAEEYFHPYSKSSSIMSTKAKNVGRSSQWYSGGGKAVWPGKTRSFRSTSSKSGSYHCGSTIKQDNETALRTAAPCCSYSGA